MFVYRCSDCSPTSVARASGNGNAANMGQNADQYVQRYGEQRYGEHYPPEQRYPQEQHYPQEQRYQPDQRYPQEQQRYEEQHQQYYTHHEPAYNLMGAQPPPPPPEERHYTRAECVLSYNTCTILLLSFICRKGKAPIRTVPQPDDYSYKDPYRERAWNYGT